MKKMSKKILSFVLAIMMLVPMATPVMAVISSPSEIQANQANVNTEGIANLGTNIVGILTTIGMIVSVVVLVVLGIKYMMGSAEEKAEYKKTLIPYIIGAGLVFAASAIANLVFTFTTTALPTV